MKPKQDKHKQNNILVVDYVDEMKKDYIDYSMSVIVARALPDVRDGLKPVHRRILWSMAELGLLPDKSYRKCARIVGDVLGKYHPHGDTSVYDALVRMAQDFRMGTTLIDGHGNFGSVDGDGSAAMRYCLVGNTIMSTNKGLLKIKDIVSNSEINSDTDIELSIKSFEHKINQAIKFFNSGIHPIKEVITELGYSVKGSYNHPVLTLTTDKNGKPIFYWKTIYNLKLGDYLVVDRNSGMISSDMDYVSENEAKFLGGIVSEGYISPKYNKVCFTNSDAKFVDEMEDCFKELFKDENVIKYYRKDGCWDVYITTKRVNEIKEKYNYGDYSEHKTVPDLILKSSLKTQSLFLRYLFEGDGSVRFKEIIRPGRKQKKDYKRVDTHITYTSKSTEMLKQIQVMLLQYGIYSSILPDKECYRVIITGKQNIKLFYENIGFAYERKQKLLLKAYESTKNENGFISLGKDQIPYIKEYIINNCDKKYISKYGFTNKSKYEKNRGKLVKLLSEDNINLIEYLHSLNYLYVPVTEIKEAGEEVVYSVKVDSDCHSFVANGIINHNTEAKLTEFSTELLKDLEKDVIDFKDNFDGSEKEPKVLPSRLPNLLINGSKGIAVGMATNIPAHNTAEVLNAIIAFIDKPKISIDELLEYIQGPDFPSGGTIINKDEMLEFYRTGNAKIITRAKIEQENVGNGKVNIVITEIPYTYSGSKTTLLNNIITLVNNKILDELSDVRDESSRDGMRVVLEVKKGVDIDNLLNKIYEKTGLQDQDTYNFLVLDNQDPKVINLKEYMNYFLEFQKEITKRKYEYLLKKAEERKEILEGLVRATNVIDIIIEVLRGSKSVKMAKECLLTGKTDDITFKTKKSESIAKTFDFTERQTNAILERRLLTLTNLEVEKLVNDFEEIKRLINEYTKIINSEKKQLSVIKGYLKEYKNKFNTPRKTLIDSIKIEKYKEVFKEEDINILVDKFGYIKTMDTTAVEKSSNDIIKELKYNIISKNTDKVAVFTNKGNLYQIKTLDIPKGKFKDKGIPIETLCNMQKGEYPVFITSSFNIKDATALFISSSGLIKKIICNEFESKNKVIASTKLEGKDELVNVKIIESQQENLIIEPCKEIAVVTKKGFVLKFRIDDIPMVKKASKGVKAIEFSEDGDNIECMYTISKKGANIERINGKEVDLSKIPVKGRAKKGSKV